jgi:hypothetical protein
MNRKYKRNEFIKLGALGAAGFYLSACGIKSDNKEVKQTKADTVAAPPQPQAKQELPLPKLFKKGDPEYDKLRQGFNKRIDKYPVCYHLC